MREWIARRFESDRHRHARLSAGHCGCGCQVCPGCGITWHAWSAHSSERRDGSPADHTAYLANGERGVPYYAYGREAA